MAVVLITGGTGLVGKALTKKLLSSGHEVRILSRNFLPNNFVKSFYWNINKREIDEKAFEGVEHILHLAGSGISDERWTSARKKEIIDSRVKSMALITPLVKRKNIHLTSFVGASAIGFYGMIATEKIYQETDPCGNDFLSDVCFQWESSYKEINAFSAKTSIIRTGVVLSNEGGALKKLVPVFKAGLGSALGNGKQYLPWIHINDLVSIYEKALFDPEYKGVYNAVSPQHITNKNFSKELAGCLSRPFFMPSVPGFALKVIFGRMAGMMLTGSRISNQKLIDAGFRFEFPDLRKALSQILSGKNS